MIHSNYQNKCLIACHISWLCQRASELSFCAFFELLLVKNFHTVWKIHALRKMPRECIHGYLFPIPRTETSLPSTCLYHSFTTLLKIWTVFNFFVCPFSLWLFPRKGKSFICFSESSSICVEGCFQHPIKIARTYQV